MRVLKLSRLKRALSVAIMISMLGTNSVVYADEHDNNEILNESIYENEEETTIETEYTVEKDNEEKEIDNENILESEIEEDNNIVESENKDDTIIKESNQEDIHLENETDEYVVESNEENKTFDNTVVEESKIGNNIVAEENNEDDVIMNDEDTKSENSVSNYNIDNSTGSLEEFRDLIDSISDADDIEELFSIIDKIHKVYNNLSDEDKKIVKEEYDYILQYEEELLNGENHISTNAHQLHEDLKIEILLRYEGESNNIKTLYGYGNCKDTNGHSGYNHSLDCAQVYNSVKDEIPSGWDYWKYCRYRSSVNGSLQNYGNIAGVKQAHYNITGRAPYKTDEVIVIYYKKPAPDNTKETINLGYGSKYNWNEYIVYHSNYPSKQGNKDYTVTYNVKANYDWSCNSDKLKNYNDIKIFNVPQNYKLKNLVWNTEHDGSGTSYTNGQYYSIKYSNRGKTLHLYAQYEPNGIKLTYIDRGLTYREIESKDGESSIDSLAINCTKTNGTKRFVGWDTSSDATNVVYKYGDSISVSKDTTLYAVWKEPIEYKVYWLDENDNNIIEPSTRTGYEDDNITLSDKDKNYVDTSKWVYDDSNSKNISLITSLKKDMALKLYYKRSTASYKIECYDELGNIIRQSDEISSYKGEEIIVPDEYKVLENYTYDEDNINNFIQGELTDDLTIFKLYFKTALVYSVEYLDEDGNSIKESDIRSGFKGDTINVKDDDKILENYAFDSENMNNILSDTLDSQDKVLRVYFKTKLKYTVQFLDETDKEIKDNIVREGFKYDTINATDEDKVLENYTFDLENTNNILSDTLDSQDKVLKLYFIKNKNIISYKVEFLDENGDSIKDTITREGFENEEVEVRDEDKILENYTFDLENTNNVLSDILDSDDIVLKVYFKKNKKTVSYSIERYDENGNLLGDVIERKADKGAKVSIKDSDKKFEGYIFDSENNENILSCESVDNDTILKVYFKKVVKPSTPSDADKEEPEDKPSTPSNADKEEPPKKEEEKPEEPSKPSDENSKEEEKPEEPSKPSEEPPKKEEPSKEEPKKDTIPSGNNSSSGSRNEPIETPVKTINNDTVPLGSIHSMSSKSVVDKVHNSLSTVINEINTPLGDVPNDTPNEINDEKVPLDSPPKTSDNTNKTLYILTLLISLLGLVVILGKKKED